MFPRKNNRPWYLKTIAILVTIRILFGFAKFFLKASYRQGNPEKIPSRRSARN
jgi:hypothetical protein